MNKPRALHCHVLAALGLAWTPAFASPVSPPDSSLAALDRSCPAVAARPAARLSAPITFEPTAGANPDFVARGPARSLALRASGPAIQIRNANVRLVLADADPGAKAAGECLTVARSNYFVGAPEAWRANVPNYARVRYEGVRPGVDIAYYGREGAVEYDIIARAGSDPLALNFAIEGGTAARIDERGDLVIDTNAGEVRHHRPIAYQRSAEGTQDVAAKYVLTHDAESLGWSVGFDLGAFDSTRDLVIDPVLSYSTLVGSSGSTSDFGGFLAVDPAGHVVIGGTATSTALGGSGSALSPNIEVYKFDPATNTVLFTTYLGGSGNEALNALAVDTLGRIYLAGSTTSADFPTCFATSDCAVRAGSSDAFVMRLGSSGSLDYSMLIGGSGGESAFALAVGASGHVYVAGGTNSQDFPVVNAINPTFIGGSGDAWVARVVPTPAGGIDFATYLGSSGGSIEEVQALAVDASGNIFVGGFARAGMTLVNPAHAYFGGNSDGFVMKLAAPSPGSSIQWSTYVGGSGDDSVNALALLPGTGLIAAAGNASFFMPTTPGAPYPFNAGGADAFVARYGTASGSLFTSTFLGSSGNDFANALVADPTGGGVYVAGTKGPGAFPQIDPVPGAFTGSTNETSAFVAHLGASASFDFSTVLGGSGSDFGESLARAADGSVWVGGSTVAFNFPQVPPGLGMNSTGPAHFFASRLSPFVGGSGSAAAPFDLDGDGDSDIPLRGPNGQVVAWLMNGTQITDATLLLGGSGNYQVTHLPDLDGDSRADMVLQGPTGDLVAWLMQGASVQSSTLLLGPGSGYSVDKIGDFNGDGRQDLLLRHVDGTLVLWQMNGASVSNSSTILGGGTGFGPALVADFNGDGRSDIVLAHPDGRATIWIMNGSTIIGSANVLGAGTGYVPTHAADSNGDGRADIYFRGPADELVLWIMNGTSITSSTLMLGGGTGYRVSHTGDFDDDKNADLLLRHSDGSIVQWLMNGSTILGSTLMASATPWKVTHVLDFKADGRADILLRGPDGEIVQWEMNGATIVASVLLVGPTPYNAEPKP